MSSTSKIKRKKKRNKTKKVLNKHLTLVVVPVYSNLMLLPKKIDYCA